MSGSVRAVHKEQPVPAGQTIACRSGAMPKVVLDEVLIPADEQAPDLVTLDDALQALSAGYSRHGEVVELRFFGGLTLDETAEVLGVSRETVKRDWRFAKLWILREVKRAS